ncbi:hypothetical protein [Arcticibacterium luteifluviistationis]|uniref:Uncharacterized protein n=1 Tax=Arcticibacterium luteifluviistationis TaxID=1784714 RepID=A0A2Z4G814_9BACT|nr:hypothetical protein [Arcticibacterium luteifluviistationis]AWV97286.1 hypothetical protein DJ013_03520 [Arcticibacterium luteifluviistationis]
MDINKLLEKYMAGETTLEEEKFLLDNASNPEQDMAAWFKYAKHKKRQPTPNLGEKIWATISKKTLRFKIGMFAAAASILLLAFFSLQNLKQEKLAYKEKEATLKEALAMLSVPKIKPAAASIIYEDDLVIIYTSPK